MFSLASSALDLRDMLAPGAVFEQGYVRTLCPFHGDQHTPGGAVYDVNFYCYTCGEWRGYDDTASMIKSGVLKPIRVVKHREPSGYLPLSLAVGYQTLLDTRLAFRLKWLSDRGISLSAAVEFRLGHTGKAFTIPVFKDGRLEAMRFRADPYFDLCVDTCKCSKYFGLGGHNSGVLYAPREEFLHSRTVVLTEGEFDALMLAQHGIPAVSSISGAQDTKSLESLREYDRVFLAYDQDEAGHKGASKVAAFLGNTKRVTWKTAMQGNKVHPKDVSDFVQLHGIGAFRDRLSHAR